MQEEIYNEFIDTLHVNMSRIEYVHLFLTTFLGKVIPPTDIENFYSICHKIINSVSLCWQEVEFFHNLVTLNFSDNYINNLIDIYFDIEHLDNCSLGYNILRCLIASEGMMENIIGKNNQQQQLKTVNSNELTSIDCCICLEIITELFTFVPCGHINVCNMCYNDTLNVCPICQKKIDMRVKLYK